MDAKEQARKEIVEALQSAFVSIGAAYNRRQTADLNVSYCASLQFLLTDAERLLKRLKKEFK